MTEAPCPHCGEPVEDRQLVCLNCGGRVALKERTPWAREPVTALAAVLVVVIVIGAGLFGFAISELTSGDGDGGDRGAQQAATEQAEEGPAVVSGGEQPTRTAEGVAPAEEAPRETETTPAETTPAEPPAEGGGADAEGGGADAVPGWPAGLRAHTVVLVSSSDHAAALNVAKEARGSGLEAGLIRSEPYDLGTGLWIVYSGRFTTPEGAQRQAAQLADRYPGAYPQLVQRSQ